MTAKNVAATKNPSVPTEIVPLHQIEIDEKWNARSSVEVSTGGPGEDSENSFEALCSSIESTGGVNRDAVKLARVKNGEPAPNGKLINKPYFLVAGFRRVAAIRKVAEQKGTAAKAAVKAEINAYTATEARKENLRENTARANLGPKDLVFGLGAMMHADPTLSGNQIAGILGMSQGYVATLVRIHNNVTRAILEKWRSTPAHPVTVKELDEIAKLGKGTDEQKAAFEKASNKGEEEKSKGGRGSWIETAKKQANTMGILLATLVRADLIEITDSEALFSHEHVRKLVPSLKDKATEAETDAVVATLEKAYNGAIDGDTEVAPEKSTDEKPKRGRKAKDATAN